MIELKGKEIWAVPYRNRRKRTPIKLVDGCTVQELLPGQEDHLPHGRVNKNRIKVSAFFELKGQDRFLGDIGVYLIPSGGVAVVYG